MNPKEVERRSRKLTRHLKHCYCHQHKMPYHSIIHQIDLDIISLEGKQKKQRKAKEPNDDSAYLNMTRLINHMKYERIILLHYLNHINDTKYIVLSNWSLNDLSDSNNDLINDSNLATWRTIGCKVYGKLGPDSKAEEQIDNHGYFASFNYPINIVKAPKIYFYSKKELNDLYNNISSHNPKLGKYLVAMAKAGTIQVHTFKTLFGLSDRQIKAKIAKTKADETNDIPSPSIKRLEEYYQWELRQRREYDHNDSDLSAYDSDQDTPSDFASDIKNWKEFGNGDYDEPDDWNDFPNGPEYDTYSDTPQFSDSDLEAGNEFVDPNSDFNGSDDYDFSDDDAFNDRPFYDD